MTRLFAALSLLFLVVFPATDYLWVEARHPIVTQPFNPQSLVLVLAVLGGEQKRIFYRQLQAHLIGIKNGRLCVRDAFFVFSLDEQDCRTPDFFEKALWDRFFNRWRPGPNRSARS